MRGLDPAEVGARMADLSVKDLKALLRERGVDISACVEKADLVRLAQESGGAQPQSQASSIQDSLADSLSRVSLEGDSFLDKLDEDIRARQRREKEQARSMR